MVTFFLTIFLTGFLAAAAVKSITNHLLLLCCVLSGSILFHNIDVLLVSYSPPHLKHGLFIVTNDWMLTKFTITQHAWQPNRIFYEGFPSMIFLSMLWCQRSQSLINHTRVKTKLFTPATNKNIGTTTLVRDSFNESKTMTFLTEDKIQM